jgi:hypothetical protein
MWNKEEARKAFEDWWMEWTESHPDDRELSLRRHPNFSIGGYSRCYIQDGIDDLWDAWQEAWKAKGEQLTD